LILEMSLFLRAGVENKFKAFYHMITWGVTNASLGKWNGEDTWISLITRPCQTNKLNTGQGI
jgi:hypothetical protein